MHEALDEIGVGGSEFHTNIILEVIKSNEQRILTGINTPSGASETDNIGGILCIRNEDSDMESIHEGISPEYLVNGRPIQGASRQLAQHRTCTIQEDILSSRRL